MYKFFSLVWHSKVLHYILLAYVLMSPDRVKYTTVHNVKPVAYNDKVTGTSFLYKQSQTFTWHCIFYVRILYICL